MSDDIDKIRLDANRYLSGVSLGSTRPEFVTAQPQPYAINDKVALEPFPENVVVKEVKGGMIMPKQKGTLTKLRVVYGGNGFTAGDSVYLRSELFAALWAKEIFEVEGQRFILAPKDQVVLVDPRR